MNRSSRLSSAKEYSRQKYILALSDSAYLFLLLLFSLSSGITISLQNWLSQAIRPAILINAAYLLAVLAAYYIADFPLNFYRSFILEKKYGLSVQSTGNWLKDQLKSFLITYLFGFILIWVFRKAVAISPQRWWVLFSFFWVFFSLLLAKILPVIIIPLFYKYKKLSDQVLAQRIRNLAEKMRIGFIDCYEINFSSKTIKANAAFAGIGSTKRVILADTLKGKYTDEEILLILAHEFAHYRFRHIYKLLIFNSALIILSFYLIFRTSHYFISFFGLASLGELAALPLVLAYLFVVTLITQPAGNFVARTIEKNADKAAVMATQDKNSFISLMNKLAEQNLSDRNPPLIVKIFFYDHPPVDERIAMIKDMPLADR